MATKIPITCCVWDTGFFTSVAEYLAQHYKKVLYYTPRESGYMKSNDERVGEGLDDVERIYSVWDKIDKIDLFVFTDCFFATEQEYLKGLGKLVWGSGKTSWMEQNRFKTREWQKAVGLKTPTTEEVIGIDELKSNLKDNQFVKINKYRADSETIKHYDKVRSVQRFDDLKVKLGGYQDEMPFLIENKIDGVEVGYDMWNVRGEYPEQALWGMEVKDRGYLGKVSYFEELPKPIQEINNEAAKVFKVEKMCGMYSNEARIKNKEHGYLIDSTLRFPNPPFQLHLTLWKNFAECIYQGARGEFVEPESVADYGAIAIINSDFAVDNWLSIKIPDESKPFTMILNACKIKGETYTIPLYGLSEIGAVVGLGDTPKGAIENCKEHADGIKGDSVEIDTNAIDEALETLEESESYGVEF